MFLALRSRSSLLLTASRHGLQRERLRAYRMKAQAPSQRIDVRLAKPGGCKRNFGALVVPLVLKQFQNLGYESA